MVDVFFLHQNMDLYCSSTMQILDQNNIFFFKYFVNIHFSGLRQYKEKSNKCTLNLIDFIVLIYSNQIICWEHYRYIYTTFFYLYIVEIRVCDDALQEVIWWRTKFLNLINSLYINRHPQKSKYFRYCIHIVSITGRVYRSIRLGGLS